MKSSILKKSNSSNCNIFNVSVSIENTEETTFLVGETDESYSMNVDNGYVSISSKNVWGAIRSLITLEQVVYSGELSLGMNVVDEPRFPYRGIMIDTGRHFISVDTILTLVDFMSKGKFNVLHVHILDAQSVPLSSKKYPALKNGAFSSSQIYSSDDLSHIVSYASLLGIQVIFEVDTPSHAFALSFGYPELLPQGYQTSGGCDWEPCESRGISCRLALSPIQDLLYNITSDLFLEQFCGTPSTSFMFPPQFFHMGLDETETGCWSNDESITSFFSPPFTNGVDKTLYYLMTTMKKTITNVFEDHKEFVESLFSLSSQEVENLRSPSTIVWDDVFQFFPSSYSSKEFPSDITVQVWGGQNQDPKFVKQFVCERGNAFIDSSKNNWYFYGKDIDYERYYDHEPTDGLTEGQGNCIIDDLLLGGEGCLWEAEESDILPTIIESRNGFLIAERLWSEQNVSDAQNRIDLFWNALKQMDIGTNVF